MHVKRLHIENMFSIETITLEFGTTGLILLDGWNHDDDTSNGSGKTSVFCSLAYSLYGKYPRKMSVSEIVRDGQKYCLAETEIEIDGDIYTSIRSRPGGVKFTKNGSPVIMSQEEFESKLKLNYSQFLLSMYAAQRGQDKFISLNDSGKKDFLLELMNLQEISDKKIAIDDEIDSIESKVDKLDRETSKHLASIEVHKKFVDKSLLNLADLKQERFNLEQIKSPDLSKYEDVERKIYAKRERSMEVKMEISSLNREIKTLNHTLCNIEYCPSCSVPLDNDPSIVTANIDKLNSKLSVFTEELSKIPDLDDLSKKIKDKRNAESASYASALTRIRELDRLITKAEDSDKHVLAIDNIEWDLQNIRAEKGSHQDKLLTLKAISGVLAPTGVPAYIMDSIVDAFNETVANYVNLIWPNASYTLTSFKENKDGDVKAKFSEKLLIAGTERSVGALSGGEYRCLSLAVDFALIDILNSRFSIELNPIILDEQFNDLDAANRERVVDLLIKLAVTRQIWVIDHASEVKAMFSKVVMVEKHNGATNIVA